MLLDLESFEAEATRLLPSVSEGPKNVRMAAFDVLPPRKGFACPLLNWTLPCKTGESVRGIVILQDWWNEAENLNDAVHYITKVTNGLYDPTLTPLFGSRSWFSAFVDREDGWLATNAVWGLRPLGIEKVGYLGDETHQVAFLVWARIVKDLIELNPKLKIVIAGKGWSGYRSVIFKSELEEGPNLPAAEVFGLWHDWLCSLPTPDRGSSSLAFQLRSMQSQATVEHWIAPSVWTKDIKNGGYGGTPPPP
jgi:hypothetical protein